jgi:GT2 family glycosyltransferase
MRVAYAAAVEEGSEFYLWLNDDVDLRDDAVSQLLRTYREVSDAGSPMSIVVGAVTNDSMKDAIYGGINRRRGWNRLRFHTFTELTRVPVECDTICGNVVLIPAAVAKAVGNIDQTFQHILGDLDYGLRARILGYKIWIAPGFAGIMTAPDAGLRIYNPSFTFRERWRIQRTPFGLRFHEWWTFCKRHGGVLAPVYFLFPYWRLLVPSSIQLAINRIRKLDSSA